MEENKTMILKIKDGEVPDGPAEVKVPPSLAEAAAENDAPDKVKVPATPAEDAEVPPPPAEAAAGVPPGEVPATPFEDTTGEVPPGEDPAGPAATLDEKEEYDDVKDADVSMEIAENVIDFKEDSSKDVQEAEKELPAAADAPEANTEAAEVAEADSEAV